MDELLDGPRLEKRIMPLLDVALSLVGVLIVMVSINSKSSDSGIEGNVARIQVKTNGDVIFGETILATTIGGIDHVKMQRLFEQLAELDDPLVLMYYTLPSEEKQNVNARIIGECIAVIETNGYKVRPVGQKEEERRNQ